MDVMLFINWMNIIVYEIKRIQEYRLLYSTKAWEKKVTKIKKTKENKKTKTIWYHNTHMISQIVDFPYK